MKEKIIKVSIPLFDEKGYSKTSIQDIVDCLDVTKGTFYYYYKSKQELLEDINVNFIDYMLDQQNMILTKDDLSCEEKLYNIIYMVISSIRTRKQHARLSMREIRHIKESKKLQINQKRREFRINIQHLIDEGIERGEFKDNLRSDIVTLGILGMTNWSYYWYNPEGEVTEEEVANILVEMIKNGISPN